MRFLINYIRQCFCKHEFKYSEGQMYKNYYSIGYAIPVTKAHLTCHKCGYVKSYWKGK